jgi:hypothetical protein
MTLLILVRQALLYADRSEAFKCLPRCTVGFVALGSPFMGTRLQSLADWAAQLLVLTGSHRGILTDLAFSGPTLRDRLQELCRFRDTLSIPTCCFFELCIAVLGY